MKVEVPDGEVVDKITILEIKLERLEPDKRGAVRLELEALRETWSHDAPLALDGLPELDGLREVNRALWDIEETVRRCEADGDFGERFVEAARAVYRLNDARARLKRSIGERTGSRLMEQKSYV